MGRLWGGSVQAWKLAGCRRQGEGEADRIRFAQSCVAGKVPSEG